MEFDSNYRYIIQDVVSTRYWRERWDGSTFIIEDAFLYSSDDARSIYKANMSDKLNFIKVMDPSVKTKEEFISV